jgi:hypothetical protein
VQHPVLPAESIPERHLPIDFLILLFMSDGVFSGPEELRAGYLLALSDDNKFNLMRDTRRYLAESKEFYLSQD